MKRLLPALIVLLLLPSTFGAGEPMQYSPLATRAPILELVNLSAAQEITLAHDDGVAEGFAPLYGTRGYLVKFTTPPEGMEVTRLQIFAMAIITKADVGTFTIEVWNDKLRPIYSTNGTHRAFSNVPRWVDVGVQRLFLKGDFYIFVNPASVQGSEVSLGYDSSSTNRASDLGNLGGGLAEWSLSYPFKTNTNWMMRATGNVVRGAVTELKYDDGSMEVSVPQQGDKGFLIKYPPPVVPFQIKGIKVYGARLPGTDFLEFRIEIWDKDFKPLIGASLPYTRFSTDFGWAEIGVPDVVVRDVFYVFLNPNAPTGKEFLLGVDSSISNLNTSFFAIPGKIAYEGMQLSNPTIDLANWMIRIEGSQLLLEAPMPATTAPPPTTQPPETAAP
ncbi:MAG: hypothetical protein AABX40_09340, partial [Candidatus Hydrothermarchaeota archaeon]